MGLFSDIFNKNNDVDNYQKECMIEFEGLKRKVKADVEDEKIFKNKKRTAKKLRCCESLYIHIGLILGQIGMYIAKRQKSH